VGRGQPVIPADRRRSDAGTCPLQSPYRAASIRSTSKAARTAAEKSSNLLVIDIGISGEFYFGTSGENSRGIDRLWQKTLPRISGKSKPAEAIRDATSRRSIFDRFLTDGRIELDSNIVERAIRPQTITRKNSLFAGNDGGGRIWATIATLLQTAKMNNVDPQAWLTQTLERIANGWPSSDLDALMPWNYAR
jgi:hypothetical protein